MVTAELREAALAETVSLLVTARVYQERVLAVVAAALEVAYRTGEVMEPTAGFSLVGL